MSAGVQGDNGASFAHWSAGIERVTLRRISPGFAFANVRLPGVNLLDLAVKQRVDGTLSITPPGHTDTQGRTWPSYHLQPHAKEAVASAVAALWQQSESTR